MELTELTVEKVRELVGARKVSARELAQQHLARIEKRNAELNAFLSLCPERALAQADAVDRQAKAGEPLPPLAGVPMAIKDVIVTRGVPTTAGSRILEGYVPPYDATAVARLEQAGAVDRKSTRLNSSHQSTSRMPSSA